MSLSCMAYCSSGDVDIRRCTSPRFPYDHNKGKASDDLYRSSSLTSRDYAGDKPIKDGKESVLPWFLYKAPPPIPKDRTQVAQWKYE